MRVRVCVRACAQAAGKIEVDVNKWNLDLASM